MTPQDLRILRLLREAGRNGVPNYKLAEISLQYNGRIHSLTNHGHDIKKERIYHGIKASNTYRYYLAEERATPAYKVTEWGK